MPRQVTAWEAVDGKVYPNERMAAEADARHGLNQLSLFNEATIHAMIERASQIYLALQPVVRLTETPDEQL